MQVSPTAPPASGESNRLVRRSALRLFRCIPALVAVFATYQQPATAQQQDGNAGQRPVQTRLEVQKVRVDYRKTPEFADELSAASSTEMDWLKIDVEFETRVSRGEYTDELEFAWAVGLKTPTGPDVVMKRNVSYLDIRADEECHVVLYIRPRFIQRQFNDNRIGRKTLRVYLEVRDQGDVIYRFHYPETRPSQPWWQLAEPRIRRFDGELLTRLETPFAPMDFNYYEYIKPERYD